jgi:hypothetical protein
MQVYIYEKVIEKHRRIHTRRSDAKDMEKHREMKLKRNVIHEGIVQKTRPKIDGFLETEGEGVPTKPAPKARGP